MNVDIPTYDIGFANFLHTKKKKLHSQDKPDNTGNILEHKIC
jgi:hypothetical protein